MNRSWVLILLILAVLNPSRALSYDYSADLTQWLQLLKTGNEREKKLALDSLWFLNYPEYRKDVQVFDFILEALRDPNPSIRQAAAACLKKIGCCPNTQVVSSLIAALQDPHPRVREEAAKALSRIYDPQAVEPLTQTLKDQDPWVKLNAVFALGELKAKSAVNPLLELLHDGSGWRNKFIQQEIFTALRKIGSSTREVKAALIEHFNDEYFKIEIIKTIGALQVEEARDLLEQATQDADAKVRKLAFQALTQIPHPPSRQRETAGVRREDQYWEVFIKSLEDPSAEIRAQSIAILGKGHPPQAVEPLMKTLHDTNDKVVENALQALAHFPDVRILDAMVHFTLRRPKFNPPHLAAETFKSVAEKTRKDRVYIYLEGGERKQSPRPLAASKGTASYRELLVHPAAVEKLIRALPTADVEGQEHLLRMLRNFDDPRIEGIALDFLKNPSGKLRGEAVDLLVAHAGETAIPSLIQALEDPDEDVRKSAVRALGTSGDPRAVDPLLKRLQDGSNEVRAAAVASLGKFDDAAFSALLMKLLVDPSSSVRAKAVWILQEKPDPRAVEPLITLLADPSEFITCRAAEALGKIGDPRAIGPLIDTLQGKSSQSRSLIGDRNLRKSAAGALGAMRAKEAVPVLLNGLQDSKIKWQAIIALGRIQDERAVPALIQCLADKNPTTRSLAVSALRNIGSAAALEAVKNFPEEKRPRVTSGQPAQPIFPMDRESGKSPTPTIPRGSSIPAGISPLMRERLMGNERIVSQPQEKTPPPPSRSLPSYPVPEKPQERSHVDIQPILARLKAEDDRSRREAADQLGDTRERDATEALLPLLQDKNEYVRQAAARALGKIKDPRAVQPLIASLKDQDFNVRFFSVWALGEIQDIRAAAALTALLAERDVKIREEAFEALRRSKNSGAKMAMVQALLDKAQRGSTDADFMLGRLISMEGSKTLLQVLADPGGSEEKTVRNTIRCLEGEGNSLKNAVKKALVYHFDRTLVISELSSFIQGRKEAANSILFLSQFKDPRVTPILIRIVENRQFHSTFTTMTAINALNDSDTHRISSGLLLRILKDDQEPPGIREGAARVLGQFREPRAVEPLIRILQNRKAAEGVRKGAAVALGAIGDQRAVQPLIDVFQNPAEDLWLRVFAVASVGNIGDERAIAPLQNILLEPSDQMRSAAEQSLRKIQKRP